MTREAVSREKVNSVVLGLRFVGVYVTKVGVAQSLSGCKQIMTRFGHSRLENFPPTKLGKEFDLWS